MEEKKDENKEKDDDLFGLSVPLIFVAFVIVGAVLFFFEEGWLPASIPLAGALIWAILAFRIVPPAFAGLVFRLGSRVSVGEEKEEDYLIKKEGWTMVFPILEKIVPISLRQHKEEINAQRTDETEDAYKNRAESFSTAEGVNIFPEIFFSYKIKEPGKVFELGGGIDEDGDSPFLVEMLHNLVIGGTRGVLAKMKLEEILSRTIEGEPIGEKIKNDIDKTPSFDRLGVELLILRIEDIKFKKDAQDVLDALEDIKKQELKKRSEIIEAEKRLEIQKKDSETLINKSEAELTKAKNEAAAANAAIAAFVGKKKDEPTTAEDGKAYAQFQIGLEVAKSFATGTKVIIPAGDISKVMAGLVNIFDASKSN
ncbi:MAG: SPFH domain-containing protein [Patescibacteria group bacterium]